MWTFDKTVIRSAPEGLRFKHPYLYSHYEHQVSRPSFPRTTYKSKYFHWDQLNKNTTMSQPLVLWQEIIQETFHLGLASGFSIRVIGVCTCVRRLVDMSEVLDFTSCGEKSWWCTALPINENLTGVALWRSLRDRYRKAWLVLSKPRLQIYVTGLENDNKESYRNKPQTASAASFSLFSWSIEASHWIVWVLFFRVFIAEEEAEGRLESE